jgi:hypothetical protein
MQSYSSALAFKSMLTNRINVDPRVLGDQEWKARQILIKLFNEKGTNTIDQSLDVLMVKANKALDSITNKDKPNNTKVVVVLKQEREALFSCQMARRQPTGLGKLRMK